VLRRDDSSLVVEQLVGRGIAGLRGATPASARLLS
jgi:hypothetical protein